MNAVARTLRFVEPGQRNAERLCYWRSRPLADRLQEVLDLHWQGNELFRNGNPPFAYVIELRHVPAP